MAKIRARSLLSSHFKVLALILGIFYLDVLNTHGCRVLAAVLRSSHVFEQASNLVRSLNLLLFAESLADRMQGSQVTDRHKHSET